MKKSTVLMSVVFSFSLLLILNSCSYTPLSEDQKEYAGAWYAEDNTWLKVYLSGQGDFDLGGKTMSGGKCSIADGKIVMSVMGIEQIFTITKDIEQNDEGEWTIELDNIKYTKR